MISWHRKLPEEDRAVPTEMLYCLADNHEYVIEMKELEDYLK